MALGCFMAARLAADRAGPNGELSDDGRAARAAAARSWLGTLTLPLPVRAPLTRCIDCSSVASAAALSGEIEALRDACASFLDAGSRAELDALAEALRDVATSRLPGRADET